MISKLVLIAVLSLNSFTLCFATGLKEYIDEQNKKNGKNITLSDVKKVIAMPNTEGTLDDSVTNFTNYLSTNSGQGTIITLNDLFDAIQKNDDVALSQGVKNILNVPQKERGEFLWLIGLILWEEQGKEEGLIYICASAKLGYQKAKNYKENLRIQAEVDNNQTLLELLDKQGKNASWFTASWLGTPLYFLKHHPKTAGTTLAVAGTIALKVFISDNGPGSSK